MYNYGELELLILSCIWIEPELLNKTKLEDKYFKYNRKLWIFFKSFYKKFGMFDSELMCRVVDSKYKYGYYINEIAELEPTSKHFKMYESLLIDLYQEEKKEEWLRNKVFNLANDFYMKNIDSKEFKKQLDTLYNNAEKIYKNN